MRRGYRYGNPKSPQPDQATFVRPCGFHVIWQDILASKTRMMMELEYKFLTSMHGIFLNVRQGYDRWCHGNYRHHRSSSNKLKNYRMISHPNNSHINILVSQPIINPPPLFLHLYYCPSNFLFITFVPSSSNLPTIAIKWHMCKSQMAQGAMPKRFRYTRDAIRE